MPSADDPRQVSPSALHRWTVLLFVSITMGCGTYYIYDSINPLERILVSELHFSATTFGMLNSAYAASAIVTLLIGGTIIDRLGTRWAVPLFATICCVGAAVTAVGGSVPAMIVGRALLGLGGESLVIAATTVIAKWFRGKELALAFGIKVMIARLASVASDNSASWGSRIFYPDGLDGKPSWQGPLLLAVGSGVIAVACAAIYAFLERRGGVDKRSGQRTAGAPRRAGFRETLRFSRSYWFLVGICLTFYSAIFPFRTFAIDFFTNRILDTQGALATTDAVRMLAHQQAGQLASLLPLSSMFATPLLGFLSDRIGMRATLLTIAAVVLMPAYALMGFTDTSLWIPLCMMGFALSVIPAVMWPSVVYLVDASRLGTAYAVMTLIEQLGFFAMNLLIGRANDLNHAGLGNLPGYRPGLIIFCGLGVAGCLFALALRARERGPHGHGLETITTAKP